MERVQHFQWTSFQITDWEQVKHNGITSLYPTDIPNPYPNLLHNLIPNPNSYPNANPNCDPYPNPNSNPTVGCVEFSGVMLILLTKSDVSVFGYGIGCGGSCP